MVGLFSLLSQMGEASDAEKSIFADLVNHPCDAQRNVADNRGDVSWK
jgi:hypothetical protein